MAGSQLVEFEREIMSKWVMTLQVGFVSIQRKIS
jgi:hypothetical protein